MISKELDAGSFKKVAWINRFLALIAPHFFEVPADFR
jgi:hypothetical protein